MVMADDGFDGFFMAAGFYPIELVLALLPSHLFLFGLFVYSSSSSFGRSVSLSSIIWRETTNAFLAVFFTDGAKT